MSDQKENKQITAVCKQFANVTVSTYVYETPVRVSKIVCPAIKRVSFSDSDDESNNKVYKLVNTNVRRRLFD